MWPSSIPSGTSIPAWAYLDVVTPDAFNVTAAQANAAQDPPESTATAGPTSTSQSIGFSSAGATSLATGTDTAVGTSTAAASSSGKKSNTGAIVGGVVGGIGGAAILAGVIAFLVIRHRRQSGTAPSAAYAAGGAGAGAAAGDFAHHDMGASYVEKPAFDAAPYAQPLPHQPAMPVYDPNDPTTFPPTSTSPSIPASTTAYNPSLNMGYASSNPNAGYVPTSMSPPPQQPFSHQPGGYSGVAEV